MNDLVPAIYQWDVDVFRAIHLGWHAGWLDPIFLVITCFGDGWYEVGLIFLCLIHPVTRQFFWPLMASLFFGGIAGAGLLKSLFERERPSLLPFAHPQELAQHHSFPSGHTTTAFALAVTLMLLTRGSKQAWWGPVALVIACLVGLSRIYRGVHWPTDVIGGCLCGTAFGIAVFLVFQARGYKWTREEAE
jgi:undecaprenyl-diphosphatase